MKSQSVIVLALIVLFLFGGLFFVRHLQTFIRPRESSSRFVMYLLTCLLIIFVLSFGMVFIITRLFPDELIR